MMKSAPENVSMLDEGPKRSWVNVPNILTVFRLIMVPILIILMLQHDWNLHWWAVSVFVIAGVTDQLDGHIARSQDLITDFGRIMDPIADKALTLSAFIMLSIAGYLPWWFTIVIAARELGVTVLRALLLKRSVVVAASFAGKFKTLLQMFLIFILLLPWSTFSNIVMPGSWFMDVVAALTLIATLWSGAGYVIESVKLFGKH